MSSESLTSSGLQAYPSVGTVIDDKYEILSYLGEGGMGAVAKAMHRRRKALVALKFMAPQVLYIQGAAERFINEAVAASKIESAHVVTIFDDGKLPNGAPYLVMEYLEGEDLSALLEREGTPGLPVARAIHFTLQILRALQVAHKAGVIHRDMKPSNCFVVTREGEHDFVKLLDFGISKVAETQTNSPSLTRTNSALGTPLYMSPEQARSPRDVDVRTDLYSVGVILYELLAGRTPHVSESGEFTEILFKLFTQDADPIQSLRPDLPAELAAVVHTCIARERDHRPATAEDMADLLAPFADDRSRLILARMRAHPSERRTDQPIPPPRSVVVSPSNAPPPSAVARTEMNALSVSEAPPPFAPAPSASRTQASGAASTGIGTTREVTPSGAPAKKSNALAIVAAAFAAVVLMGGVAAFALTRPGKTAATLDPTPVVTTPTTSPTNPPQPPMATSAATPPPVPVDVHAADAATPHATSRPTATPTSRPSASPPQGVTRPPATIAP